MSERQRAGVPLGVGTHLTYMPALDLGGVSILGIMANHGGFSWAAGGVISVNVFFVLSGFLITVLLLKEWARAGTIRLRRILGPPCPPASSRPVRPARGHRHLRRLLRTGGNAVGALRGGRTEHPLLFQQLAPDPDRSELFRPVRPVPPPAHMDIVDRGAVLCGVADRGPSRSQAVAIAPGAPGHCRGRRVGLGHRDGAALSSPPAIPAAFLRDRHQSPDILTGAAFGILLYRQPRAKTERSRIAFSSLALVRCHHRFRPRVDLDQQIHQNSPTAVGSSWPTSWSAS